MRNYHNIEKCLIRNGPYPASQYPYRGYTRRIGMDSIFLISRRTGGWSAWGLREDKPLGSYLYAPTLRELSVLLEGIH